MFTRDGRLILQAPASIHPPDGDSITYVDHTGVKVTVPLGLLVRLHEIAKVECEKRGGDWDAESREAAIVHCGC